MQHTKEKDQVCQQVRKISPSNSLTIYIFYFSETSVFSNTNIGRPIFREAILENEYENIEQEQSASSNTTVQNEYSNLMDGSGESLEEQTAIEVSASKNCDQYLNVE